MRDPLWLLLLKTPVRWMWTLEYAVRRRLSPGSYRLTGACGGCARCCEAPTLRIGRWIYFPTVRRLLVAWQRHVNGFVLERLDRPRRNLVFRCTHFDWKTRRCDSYHSRPFLCRDYPRNLLDQPWPELFEGCGFGVTDRRAAAWEKHLAGLPQAQREKLRKGLKLDE